MKSLRIFAKFCKGGPLFNENALSIVGSGYDRRIREMALKYFPVDNDGWGGPIDDADKFARDFEEKFLPEVRQYVEKRDSKCKEWNRTRITIQYIRNWKDVKV